MRKGWRSEVGPVENWPLKANKRDWRLESVRHARF